MNGIIRTYGFGFGYGMPDAEVFFWVFVGIVLGAFVAFLFTEWCSHLRDEHERQEKASACTRCSRGEANARPCWRVDCPRLLE